MGLLDLIITYPLHLIFYVLVPVKLVYQSFVNVADLITQPWRNLFWLCLNIYLTLWSKISSLCMKMLLLPFRIYNAMQREDMMEIETQGFRKLYTDAVERLKELEGELQQALDDCKQYKDLLKDAEIENKAILKKCHQLQSRVLELEEENDYLTDCEEEVSKLVVQQEDVGNGLHSEGSKDGVNVNHLDTHPQHLAGTIHAQNFDRWVIEGRGRCEGQAAALSSSLFSVFLSLLVGVISWHAQDACIPLVVAVFMVVCMSLRNVAQFVLSMYNGPGFDAMALLSFNWFILGTLAYPILPRVAQTMAPVGTKLGQWLLRLMGVNYVTDKLRTAFL